MSDRREFLTALSAVGASLLHRRPFRSSPSASVEAEATVFYGHPNGQTTLVRFVARGFNVPAGRLRVYGPRRDQLGTAGMLRTGDVLYGELWLPLERRLSISTELEMPGRRGVIRHQHLLTPLPRWTIYWLTVADPEKLRVELGALDPWRRGVRARLYAAAGVRGNPLAGSVRSPTPDHLTALRLAVSARDLESDFGIPVSPLALAPSDDVLTPTTVAALAGAGVRVVALLESKDDPIGWLEPWRGFWIPVIAWPALRDPASLGFAARDVDMASRIERWLTADPGRAASASRANAALVVGDDTTSVTSFFQAVRRWNGRFAAPRIVIGAEAELFLRGQTGETPMRTGTARTAHRGNAASLGDLSAMRRERESMIEARAHALMAILTSVVPGASPRAFDALAHNVKSRFPGALVLNTSPFTRTDKVRFTDGRDEVVTDVPGLGFAFVIDPLRPADDRGPAPGQWVSDESDQTLIVSSRVRAALDRESGAISSLLDHEGRQWVRPDSLGLNTVPHARLESAQQQVLPGVGSRLVVRRRLSDGGLLHSIYTVYEALPWLDIENDAIPSTPSRSLTYQFAFLLHTSATVSWEIPAAAHQLTAPVPYLLHLRWLQIAGGGRSVSFRGYDAPAAAVADDGTLTSYAAPGPSAYRLLLEGERSTPGWRFGWNTEPLLTIPVAPGGTGRLPSTGSLFRIDQDDIAVLGAKPADHAMDGAIIFLQELSGAPRLVSIQPGLLRFREARRVDFIERDIGPVEGKLGDGIVLRIGAYQVAAVRLSGLSLLGG